LQGLTIGETSDIPPIVVEDFRASGLSHVLAVSGSNVAIVLGAVLASLRSIGHRARIVAGFAALGMFVLVVGPDASVLRAGVMGSITLACLARGRQAEPLAALGIAIIGVIGVRPGMLFSAGMHLSVAATAGIVLWSGSIAARMPRLPTAARVMLAATLAAQIAVAPILALTFGEIPLLAPLANALALPAVGFATIVGLAAAPAAIVWPPAGRLLARSAAPAVAWIGSVAERVGGISGAVVPVPPGLGWLGLAAVATAVVLVLRSTSAR
jgi:competence protein ComEC